MVFLKMSGSTNTAWVEQLSGVGSDGGGVFAIYPGTKQLVLAPQLLLLTSISPEQKELAFSISRGFLINDRLFLIHHKIESSRLVPIIIK